MQKKIKGILLIFLYIIPLFNSYEVSDDEPELQDYEKEHIEYLRTNAAECTLFLNRDSSFPLEKPGKVLLIGSGGTKTLKGGTGSGDVESRYYTTIEEGLENAGFEIISKDWYEKYAKFKEEKHSLFVNYVKYSTQIFASNLEDYSEGVTDPQYEYDISLSDYEKADVAIYVLSRQSGEGTDRHIIKGDVYLTDSEIKDILELDKTYDKFLLVLNTVGVVDLTPVKYASNILYLSELGVVTGDILADIVLGKANPSGKLATTWASIKQYNFIDAFGGHDNVRYLEGVYVGYRYFDSVGKKPLFPFGYGKSYTSFDILNSSVENNKERITVSATVKNTGQYDGKEVLQVYVSPSQSNKDKPYQSLVGFKKSKKLEPNGEQTLKVTFKLSDIARYDEQTASYILDKGKYIIRIGNSSDNTVVCGYITLEEDITTQKLKNIGGKVDFGDFIPPEILYNDDLTNIKEIKLTSADFTMTTIDYSSYKPIINSKVKNLKIEEAAKLCVGSYDGETHLQGEAGETSSTINTIDKYLILADGPAGLRLTKKYGVDENGAYRLTVDPMYERLYDYFTEEELKNKGFPDFNKDRKGEIFYQFATAIPIATALGQSFNEDFVEMVGNLVGEEMDFFNVHLWLAPGLNIHRNILNGRNFEYYSEDPLISGSMAAAITRGVQLHRNRGTTIKHFATNNQEYNRFNGNSMVSERALREIYLKGFKIAVESSPHALMTSYNLLNGLHTSERNDLIIDVLRTEWGYDGLVMSDWYGSLHDHFKIANYPNQNAARNIKGGNNLQMGGDVSDYDIVMKAYESGELTEEDLLVCASKVYETVELLNMSEE